MESFWKLLPWKRRKFIDDSIRRWRRQQSSLVEEGENVDKVDKVQVGCVDACDRGEQQPHVCPDTAHPLFKAIKSGSVEELEAALREDPEVVTHATCGGLTPLHVACLHPHSLPVLSLLLHHAAQPDVTDSLGRTPLYLAVTERWHEGVEELLRKGASPDVECCSSTPKESKETAVQAAVRLGDAESVKKLLLYDPDLSVVDNDQSTLLHLAASNHDVDILRLLREQTCQELLHTRNNIGNSVMHSALNERCHEGRDDTAVEIIKVLLDAGLDVNSTNNLGESPIYLAACLRLQKSVRILIAAGAHLFVLTNKGQSVVHGACFGGCTDCLEALIETGELASFMIMADEEGRAPFEYAIRSSSIGCCELLLNNGDHLTMADNDGSSHCSLLIEYIPCAAELIKKLLDGGIGHSSQQQDPDFSVSFDYSSILPQDVNTIQSSLIDNINDSKSQHILKHPLIESYLCLKWSKVRSLFYGKLLIYFTFLIIHTWYISAMYARIDIEGETAINLWTFRFLHSCMYCLILVSELVTLVANPWKYFKHCETITKLISLFTSAYVVFLTQQPVNEADSIIFVVNSADTGSEGQDQSLSRQIAAISVFFGWVNLMMLCGRLPIFGTHVLMFTTIAKSAITFITAFIAIIIGFSSSFMVLFHDKQEFNTFWTSLVRTMMMMNGEINYTDLVTNRRVVISYLMLVVFLFLVCILMANLLIGLAVDDITGLKAQGTVERLSKQATYIVTYERFRSHIPKLKIFDILLPSPTIKPRKSVLVNRRLFRTKKWFSFHFPSQVIQEALSISHSRQASVEHEAFSDNEICMNRKLDILQISMQAQFDEVLAILKTLHQNKYPK